MRLLGTTSVAAIVGFAVVAGVLARGDSRPLVVSHGPAGAGQRPIILASLGGDIPRPQISGAQIADTEVADAEAADARAAETLAQQTADALLDTTRPLAAARTGFIAGGGYDTLIDPAAVHGPSPRPIGRSFPLRADLLPMPAPRVMLASIAPPPLPALAAEPAPPVAAAAPTAPVVASLEPEAVPPLPVPVPDVIRAPQPSDADAADSAEDSPLLDVPMPPLRPAEVPRVDEPERPRVAAPAELPADAPSIRHRARARTMVAAPQPAPAENRTFMQKLFGNPRPGSVVLAYASPNDAVPSRLRPSTPAMPMSRPYSSGGTAVYDISAKAVFLPNGERLEAHSGLGDKLDDPRHVNVRMRGATPPSVYDLTEREKPFHGVRALRLNPVGGAGAVHGRAGLLAHTYMLGPRGNSNGCVSFRDYNKFLQAYLRGDIKRLVVVARR